MPPLYFEVSTGKLHDIPAEQIAATPLSADIFPLDELLTSDEFPFKRGDYPRIRLSEWTRDQGLLVGAQVVQELVHRDTPCTFTTEMVRRLNIMGLFPDFNFIRKEYRSLYEFSKELKAPQTANNLRNREYDQLTNYRLMERINTNYRTVIDRHRSNELSADRPLTASIIKELHRMNLAPSLAYIQRRFGGLNKLNEVWGFPDHANWDDDQRIEYGANVLFYNGQGSLTTANALELASMGLGPYPSTIKLRFGSWGNFVRLANQELHSLIDLHSEGYATWMTWTRPPILPMSKDVKSA